ncbi:GntR family transcriptional regulator [Priestia megaterium]
MKGNSVKFTPLLNRKDYMPLYQQLYEYIKKEIVSSRVEVNDKLPSIRSLADYLNVSRNTVDMAYQQLLAEGYVESRPKSGMYVTNTQFDLLQTDKKPAVFLHPHSETKSCTYDFRYGKVDSRLFPLNEWKNDTMKVFKLIENLCLLTKKVKEKNHCEKKLRRTFINQEEWFVQNIKLLLEQVRSNHSVY